MTGICRNADAGNKPSCTDATQGIVLSAGQEIEISIAVTAFTYAQASGGGTYVVAWGAIIFGGIQFVKGLVQYQDTSRG